MAVDDKSVLKKLVDAKQARDAAADAYAKSPMFMFEEMRAARDTKRNLDVVVDECDWSAVLARFERYENALKFIAEECDSEDGSRMRMAAFRALN